MGTSPDITYAVSQVARLNIDPGPQHWKAVKRILQYIHQTVGYGVKFKKCRDDTLVNWFININQIKGTNIQVISKAIYVFI